MSENDFIKNVTRRFGEIRVRKGMTQSQLAEKLGISGRLLQDWESGRNTTLRTLYRLSKALNCSAKVFFDQPTTRQPKPGRPAKKKN